MAQEFKEDLLLSVLAYTTIVCTSFLTKPLNSVSSIFHHMSEKCNSASPLNSCLAGKEINFKIHLFDRQYHRKVNSFLNVFFNSLL